MAAVARTTFTDDAGRFSLAGLPAGRYTLVASKAPFLRTSYGAKRSDLPGTPITLEGRQPDDGRRRAPAARRRHRAAASRMKTASRRSA